MESTRVTIQAAHSDFIDNLNKSKLCSVVNVDLAAEPDDIYAVSRATFAPVDKETLDTLSTTVRKAPVSSKATRSYASSPASRRSSLATVVDADIDADPDDIYAVSRATCPPLDKEVLDTLNTTVGKGPQRKHEVPKLNVRRASQPKHEGCSAGSYASSTASRMSFLASFHEVNTDVVDYLTAKISARESSSSIVSCQTSSTEPSSMVRGASQFKHEDCGAGSYASSTTSRASFLASLHDVNTDVVDTLTSKISARGSSSSVGSCQTSSTEASSLDHRAHAALVERQRRIRQDEEAMLAAYQKLAEQEAEEAALKAREKEQEKALEARGRQPSQHEIVPRLSRLKEVANI